MTMKRRNSRRLLASAVLVALAVPGMAFAQSAKEVELEARVAQLEASNGGTTPPTLARKVARRARGALRGAQR